MRRKRTARSGCIKLPEDRGEGGVGEAPRFGAPSVLSVGWLARAGA